MTTGVTTRGSGSHISVASGFIVSCAKATAPSPKKQTSVEKNLVIVSIFGFERLLIFGNARLIKILCYPSEEDKYLDIFPLCLRK